MSSCAWRLNARRSAAALRRFGSSLPAGLDRADNEQSWPEVLAGDEVLAGAILDRLLHSATVLSIQGRSYRLRDLEASLGSVSPVSQA